MAKSVKVLGIHGLGDHRDSTWAADWKQALSEIQPDSDQQTLLFQPFEYDELFAEVTISPLEALTAFWKLAGSGLGLPRSMAEAPGVRERVVSASHFLRWYAGYVVAWLADDGFRAQVRNSLFKAINTERPQIVLAHSLGSLISYDAFSSTKEFAKYPGLAEHLRRMTYVTLGSQLANPFVVGNLTPGRIELPPVRQWYNLFNPNDSVFTASIRLPQEKKFLQVRTPFDIEGFADHDAISYLKHPATAREALAPAWLHYSPDAKARKLSRAMQRAMQPVAVGRGRRHRALLIGINDYPNPANRLGGCVNDTFRMSAVLQQQGFKAGDIRVLHNHRATRKGILDRLEWLFDDVRATDNLVFYFSGHGAQLPTYGEGDSVDKRDETLVPYDFDWSPETCITDDQIYHLYAQLPYDTRLKMIFDCCHSGGIHRDGGPRVRGLEPPDDVRHRSMRWDPKSGMWQARKIKPLNERLVPTKGPEGKAQARLYAGADGNVLRIGRAMRLRTMSHTKYDSLKRKRKDKGPIGPFLPIILEACREEQLAYEYRHGVESYGAFTFALTEEMKLDPSASFNTLLKKVRHRLTKVLGYNQDAQLLGPKRAKAAAEPWK